MKNAVVFYSNTNQSKHIASYLASRLVYPLYNVFEVKDCAFENLVFVFPVHCQGLPDEACRFLSEINVKNLTLIATYGKMCYGNALNEAQKRFKHNIVAAAYVPTKHTYIQDDAPFERFDELEPIVHKIASPAAIKIPKSYKNPFARFAKNTRSRLGVRLYSTDRCTECSSCTAACPYGAISYGKPNGGCIRCLKCVNACPSGALRFSLTAPMKLYLKKRKQNKLKIYV